MSSSDHFQDLLERARRGERAAMDQLLVILRPQIEGISREYADTERATESSSDLVQETWLRMWQKLDQFQGGDSDEDTYAMFHGWACQIAHRVGLNAARGRKVLKRAPEGHTIVSLRGGGGSSTGGGSAMAPRAEGLSPSGAFQVDEQYRILDRALQRLGDPRDAVILRLRFFEGLSLQQVAERLGLRYFTVRERYRLCLQLLERELEGLL